MNNKLKELASLINKPNFKSSYKENDCVFLLKDISKVVSEISTEEKERMINSGINYSEMLPKEDLPTKKYVDIFLSGLEDKKVDMADKIANISELIYKEKGDKLVIVSLARAGTPIGILVKRYLSLKYGVNIPHYSISIIRGKGFDRNAVAYILTKHEGCKIQFVDGWTGKGAIGTELFNSVQAFNNEFDTNLDSDLAVVADPSGTAPICATRQDIFMPNCCLNSTVSGLVSRTFVKPEVIGEYDFHGAKFYEEWIDIDYSNYFIDQVSSCFNIYAHNELTVFKKPILNCGIEEALRIKELVLATDINKIKPSIGETTRVLLRRLPKCILIKNQRNSDLKHIIHLAIEKGVPIQIMPNMVYECVGVIK